MTNRTIKFLNCTEELEKSIPIFMEAFIEYYGEEHRHEIEEKFSKAKFVGFQSIDGITSTISTFEREKTAELVEQFIKENSLDLTVKDLTGDCSFEHPNIHPITNVITLIKNNELGEEGRKIKRLRTIYENTHDYVPDMSFEELVEISNTKIIPEKYNSIPEWTKNYMTQNIEQDTIEKGQEDLFYDVKELLMKINPEINGDNFKELLKEPEFIRLLDLDEPYTSLITEYRSYKKKLEKHCLINEKMSKLKSEFNKKYQREFILENIEFIPEDRRSGLEEYKTDLGKAYNLDNYIKNVLGTSLFSALPIENFSKEKEEKLNNPDTHEWQKDSIKKQRIRYFKDIGIDLGNNYEDYLNDEKVQKMWPNQEMIEKIIESREKYQDIYNEELYDNFDNYQHLKQDLEDMNFVDDVTSNLKKIYSNNAAYVSPNFIKTETGYELYPLVGVSFNMILDDDLDHKIVHELNHLFELHVNSVGDDSCSIICGWDTIEEQFNQKEERKNHPNRPYELFNEIINELVAQEICEIMHKDKVQVFDDDEHNKYKNMTSYEDSLFLVNKFFNEYKDLIIKSRSNGNIDIILDAVGKDNFDELNGLFDTFFENFSGFKIYSLYSSLDKKEDTEQTRVFNELIEKRDIILEKMNNHYNEYLKENYQK